MGFFCELERSTKIELFEAVDKFSNAMKKGGRL